MTSILAYAFSAILVPCVLLNLASLPGNWIMAVLVAAWAAFTPAPTLDAWFFALFLFLAVLGEAMEFVLQMLGSGKGGASGISALAGMAGAIAGAIAGASLLFGFGAMPGALAGAWGGCLLSELLLRRRPLAQSLEAARATMIGRFLGMIIKFGIGAAMLVLASSRICSSI